MQTTTIKKIYIGSLTLVLTQLTSCSGESGDSVELTSSSESPYTSEVSTEEKSKHIKALFFGSGPFSSPGSRGCVGKRGHWASFPKDSLVEIVIPASVTPDDALFVSEEVDKLNAAINGYFTLSVVQSSEDVLPPASENQLTINLVDEQEMLQHCPNAPGGCIYADLATTNEHHIQKGNSYYPIDVGIFDMHEIGHGIGLCHVNIDVFPDGTMASVGGAPIKHFSDAELAAIQDVFSSGLSVGATEQDFWNEGLIP